MINITYSQIKKMCAKLVADKEPVKIFQLNPKL